MLEFGVASTDFALALECLIFAGVLGSLSGSVSPIRFWFIAFYAATAVAALTGGIVHAYLPNHKSLAYRILWRATLIAIGASALSGILVSAIVYFQSPTPTVLTRAVFLLFVVYCAVVIFYRDEFLVAIVGYLPMVVFLCFVFFREYLHGRGQMYLAGAVGGCIALIAAAVQRLNLKNAPRWFNHNVAYHILQGTGLLVVFFPALDLSK
jgi:hypothetical protein